MVAPTTSSCSSEGDVDRKTSVLIVDDSALMRQMLTKILNDDPEVNVVGAAADPLQARKMIKELEPQVLTLDIEMPRMDGLSFLEKVMTLRPMPVVMVSSLTERGADATMRALELGAVDFVAKPGSGLRDAFDRLGGEIVDKVKSAARARVSARRSRADHGTPGIVTSQCYDTTETVIAIGASTGGVSALQQVIARLPADSPGILVTQHMPPEYTARFASRLDRNCAVSVREATDRTRVLPGHVYIAPGDRHLELARSGAHYICRLHAGPPVSGHRPSVDVLFGSVAEHAGRSAVGVILTGMGADGAEGLLAMRKRGARTLGESESTCIVYGMPRAASELGAVMKEAPIERMAEEIVRACAVREAPAAAD